MADYMMTMLGDKLVTSTVDDKMPTELPSPEATTLIFSLVKDNKEEITVISVVIP